MAGGTWHGVATLHAGTHDLLWNIVMFAMGAMVGFASSGIHAADVRRGDGTIAWLGGGLVVTAVGLAVQQSAFPRFHFFNHNDAYHVMQIAGLWCFYRCARTLRDRGAARDSS
jgi:hypothetical protein